jgi:diguanylate cyclase (GGDEF)-like protein
MKLRLRLALALLSIAIYALCFKPAYSFAGMAAAALIVIPVATIGGLLGIRAGILSGLFSSVFNGLLFTLAGRPMVNNFASLLLSDLVLMGLGALVGSLRELLTKLRQQARELECERETLHEEIARRKQVEEQLAHDALHDPLTNLPNRTLFLDRLDHVLQRTKQRQNDSFAVLYLDLDRFKIVNDSLGHSTGNQLLIETAHRLVASVGTMSTVSRLGGDEFAILLEDAQDVAEATRVADQIQHALAAPFDLAGNRINTSASIGIVSNTTDYSQSEDILQDADTAMYYAKSQGRGRHEVFNVTMRDRAIARLALEADLKYALERHEFQMHYHPILRLHDKQIAGFEALLRWAHPKRGILHPAEFLAVAEEIGLMVPINWWVMGEACRQMHKWQAQFQNDPPLTISVNISPQHLTEPDFIPHVEKILCESGLAPDSLLLELTEKVIVEESQSINRIFEELQALGVRVQIDDFGTGYSSLSYLQNLPAETLKIDRSFISRMGESRDGAELVRAIVALGRALGMKVIAEGIETADQLSQLEKLDCEYGQGYLFAKPIEASAVSAFITESLKREGI